MLLKKIFFRVDSSKQIGGGHLLRCLTLADRLKERAEITFLCRDLDGNLGFLVSKAGFILKYLPRYDDVTVLSGYEKLLTVSATIDAEQTKACFGEDRADWLIVDSYAVDYSWERSLRPFAKKIMVIDDLANRRHDCDILLDQNYLENFERRYDGFVPDGCQKLLGLKYILLREEFYEQRKNLRLRDSNISNILVSLGSSDNTNETGKALAALDAIKNGSFIVNVVVGQNSPYNEKIEEFCCQRENMNFYCQVDFMASLMNTADLAIGAGGSTIWERCFLQLPSLVVSVADNQVAGCKFCADKGLIDYLGAAEHVPIPLLKERIESYLCNSRALHKLQVNGRELFQEVRQGYVQISELLLQ